MNPRFLSCAGEDPLLGLSIGGGAGLSGRSTIHFCMAVSMIHSHEDDSKVAGYTS